MCTNNELTEDSKDPSVFIFRIKQSEQSALSHCLTLNVVAIKSFNVAEAFFQNLTVIQLMKKSFSLHSPKAALPKIRFEFLPTIKVNITVFWDVLPCCLVDTHVS